MLKLELVEKIQRNSLAKDAFWAMIGSVLGKGLSLLAGILVARFLGKELFGQYGIIKNTLVNVAVFSTLGLGYTGTRYISKCYHERQEDVFDIIKIIYRVSLCTSVIMAILVIIFSQQVAIFIKAPEMDGALRLTGIIVVLNAIVTSQIGVLSGFKEFKEIAKNNTLTGIVTFLTSAFFSYLWALDGALLALLFSIAFNLIVNQNSIRKIEKRIRQMNLSKSISPVTMKEIILFSIPIALQESMYTVVHFLGSFLLITYGGYGELGIFSAAGQWASVLLFIPGVFKNVILAHFSSSEAKTVLRKRMMFVNGITTFLPWMILLFLSKLIANSYGTSFDNLHIVLSVSCLASVFSSISSVIVYELISRGKNWLMFGVRASRDMLALGLSWYLLSSNISYQPSIVFASIGTSMNMIYMFLLLFAIKRVEKVVAD